MAKSPEKQPIIQNKTYVLWYVIVACIFVTTCTQMFAPLIPFQALKKGLKLWEYFWFFAVYNGSRLVLSMLVTALISRNIIAARYRFEIGIFLVGITTFVWNFMDDVLDRAIYTGIGITLRIISAFGIINVQYYVSDMIEEYYPIRFYHLLGLIDTICVISYIIVMPVIGIMAQEIEIGVPFAILGGIFLGLSIITVPMTPNCPSYGRALMAYQYFFEFASTWTALCISFAANLSRGYVYTTLTVKAFEEPLNVFQTCFLFTANKLGYLVAIFLMISVRKDMKLISILLEVSLVLKMFSFIMYSGRVMLPDNRFTRGYDYLYVSTFFHGVTDAILIQGAFFVLKRNAEASKPLENIDTYKMVVRLNNVCNYTGSSFGSVMAGIMDATYGNNKSVIMAYMYASLAIVLVPFTFSLVHTSKTTINRRSINNCLLPRHGFLAREELRKSLNTLKPFDTASLPFILDS